MAEGGTVVVRREFYEVGRLVRVEEDVDRDGRVDKWEMYADGRVASIALDTGGRGRPTRRLFYGARGVVERLEEDADGDGVFRPVAGDEPGPSR
jgi:hypothetical protein